MCRDQVSEEARECPRCRTDLTLLAEYVGNLRDGLAEAEEFTRRGDLDQAVWAYLTVLEVDPDNATARRQVGKVATAVRQFDETAPGRRWLTKIRNSSSSSNPSWISSEKGIGLLRNTWLVPLLLGLICTLGAYWLGYHNGQSLPTPTAPHEDQ